VLKHVNHDFILVQPRQSFDQKIQFYVTDVFIENRLGLPLIANQLRGSWPGCTFERDNTLPNHVNIFIRGLDDGTEETVCGVARALGLPPLPMQLVREIRRI
jgi:hypothetical protein